MEKRICRTCKLYPECPKPTNGDDFCLGWVSKDGDDARLWNAVQEAIDGKNREKLLRVVREMGA